MTGSASEGRVLIVHPPGAQARGMADALAAESVAVETVDDVFRAIAAFSARPADVVVLSAGHLEDRDLEAVRVFREIHPPVHLLVAFPARWRERAVRAVADGADGYLPEPFYLSEFRDLVRRALERSRAAVPAPASDAADLGRLAGAVGHAVNNPLQILELLLSENKEGLVSVDDVRPELRRIAEVADELTAFARRGEIRPVPVDLAEIIRSSVPAAGGKRSKVRHDLPEDLPPVAADPKQIAAALATLARVASIGDSEGRLVVKARAENGGGGARVQVVFHAPRTHLESDEVRDYFRPYSGPAAGSVGLAAATARSVIEAHGGRVEVACRKTEGTEVRVVLPASGKRAERT